MQPEEVSFQSAFEGGQRLCCSDVHRKVIPPSWGQNELYFIAYQQQWGHLVCVQIFQCMLCGCSLCSLDSVTGFTSYPLPSTPPADFSSPRHGNRGHTSTQELRLPFGASPDSMLPTTGGRAVLQSASIMSFVLSTRSQTCLGEHSEILHVTSPQKIIK